MTCAPCVRGLDRRRCWATCYIYAFHKRALHAQLLKLEAPDPIARWEVIGYDMPPVRWRLGHNSDTDNGP